MLHFVLHLHLHLHLHLQCEYCSLPFQSFVLRHVVIAPISITKKPRGSQHPIKRANLHLIWFLLSLASISFLRDVVWVSVVLNRTVVRLSFSE